MTPGFLVPGPVLKVEPTGRKGFKYTHTIMIPPAGLLSGGRAVSPIALSRTWPQRCPLPGAPCRGCLVSRKHKGTFVPASQHPLHTLTKPRILRASWLAFRFYPNRSVGAAGGSRLRASRRVWTPSFRQGEARGLAASFGSACHHQGETKVTEEASGSSRGGRLSTTALLCKTQEYTPSTSKGDSDSAD